jgi:hypothetical protein
VTKSPAAHPAVAFAIDYSSSWSTLNAPAVIFRCDSFRRDIEVAEESMQRFKSSGEWTPPFGLEIFSYYIVGFVTCLEWHARSRLVDLFTFKPSCIQAKDLEGKNINDKVLSQTVAAKVGVSEMTEASLSVGSPEAYFTTIGRIFTELNIPKTPAELLSNLRSDSVDNPVEALQELFQCRRRIVHEISLGAIGSWIIRDYIDLAQARRFGKLVEALLNLIEREITTHTPKIFPNRLTIDGFLEDPSEFLDGEIARLEKEIAESISENPGIAGSVVTSEWWQKEIEASALASNASREFLEACHFAGQRHVDPGGPILVALKRSRLSYLTELAKNFI